jgi:uncharacterized protein (TIGR03086 family)
LIGRIASKTVVERCEACRVSEFVENTDPRPQLDAALDQTEHQIGKLSADDLGRPTPCADYNVEMLLAHIVAVVRKLGAVGRGEDMNTVTDPADDVTKDWSDEFRRARIDLDQTWSADATLDSSHILPWGRMTGRDLLDAYAHEFTVHAWDLAQVTGRVNDLDPALAGIALNWYQRNVPADSRGQDGPFGPVVDVPDNADAYSRLAGYVGRPVGT